MPMNCKGCGRFCRGCVWDLDSRALAPFFHALVILIILIFGIYLIATSEEGSRKLEIGTGFLGLAIGLPVPGIKFKLSGAAEEMKVEEAEKRLRRLARLEEVERGLSRSFGEIMEGLPRGIATPEDEVPV